MHLDIKWTIENILLPRSLGDIHAGLLTLTASEPMQMSPLDSAMFFVEGISIA